MKYFINRINKAYVIGILVASGMLSSSIEGVHYLALQKAEQGVKVPTSVGKIEHGIEYIDLDGEEAVTLESFKELIIKDPQIIRLVTTEQNTREYYLKSTLDSCDRSYITPLRNRVKQRKDIFIPTIDEKLVEVPILLSETNRSTLLNNNLNRTQIITLFVVIGLYLLKIHNK